MKKFYHLFVTRYKRYAFQTMLKQQEGDRKGRPYKFSILNSQFCFLLAAFCFLPFFAFAQTPDPGCNCIKIDNLCWATCNVATPGTFAATPTETGWYYQWGVNVGWSPTNPMTDSNGGITWNSTNPPPGSPPDPDEWLITPCPAGWRLPTQSEFADLVTTYLVPGSSTLDRLRSVNGRFFNSGDPTQPLLFLPAAGARSFSGGALNPVGTYGYYWSSTPNSTTSTSSYCLLFGSTLMNPSGNNDKTYGFTIRCVAEL